MTQQPKKILLISSGQPSLNPRLVKEADALTNAGYLVTVLYAHWNDWGTLYDEQLLAEKRWKAIRSGGAPDNNALIYLISRLIFKISRFIINGTGNYNSLSELAVSRGSYFLIKAAKKYEADLYIAHNLGALAAAVKTATYYKKPCGFDAEDFHRQEVSDDKNSFNYKISQYLEDKYLPGVSYLTAASPLIADAYHKLYPGIKTTVINNVFESNLQLKIKANDTSKLRLFWFSQTIGANRGLEDIIKALQLLKGHSFELHLLGDANETVKSTFTLGLENTLSTIYFHAPIPPGEVIDFAAQFDIGLALEQDIPLNRDICLTNKIFTYIQAGLGVIVSDTRSQTALINQYPDIGKVYQKGDARSLADILLYYQQNPPMLFETRKAALKIAHEQLNWEIESQKFLNMIEDVLTGLPE